MAEARIGTVDLPERVDRERYFRELDYLELSLLFAGPVKPSVLAKWKPLAPPHGLGLVAPWVLTHRRPPSGPNLWPHDDGVGDFRDSAPGRQAIAQLREAIVELDAGAAIFRSPPLFAPSAAHRDQLRAFFADVAPAEVIGVDRVWVPDGLWSTRTAITFANELGVLCAFDPLVREPGQPPEVYFDLDVSALYLRVTGLGRAGLLSTERQEDLAMLLEHYEDLPATIAFESPSRWADARNLKKLLKQASSDAPDDEEEESDS